MLVFKDETPVIKCSRADTEVFHIYYKAAVDKIS